METDLLSNVGLVAFLVPTVGTLMYGAALHLNAHLFPGKKLDSDEEVRSFTETEAKILGLDPSKIEVKFLSDNAVDVARYYVGGERLELLLGRPVRESTISHELYHLKRMKDKNRGFSLLGYLFNEEPRAVLYGSKRTIENTISRRKNCKEVKQKMKNLEQKTEKAYKTTLEDWVPGYGILKTYRALKKGEPNMMTDTTELLGLVNQIYQAASLAFPVVYALEKYVF